MIPPVRDRRVHNAVRWLYIGSGALLLANIGLGILNVFTEGALPRGQMLAHFHSGTIGWVTLGVIATTVWVFTGERNPSDAHIAAARSLTVFGLGAVAGYIVAFYLAFNEAGPFWLLPLFGIPAALVIWGGFLFSAFQLRAQPVVTTVHLLLFGALMVASVGATMGVLWGLTLSTDLSFQVSGGELLGAHAGPMDMYLALAFAGIVELLVRRDDTARWSKPGMTQMVFGVLAAFIVAGGLFFGVLEIAPIAMLFFLLSFLFYFFRVGYRTFVVNPFGGGRKPGIFWGGLALPAYIGMFVVLVLVFFIPERDLPHWLGIVFVHTTFVGMTFNLLFATQSAYGAPEGVKGWLEPTAFWTLNLGMLVFFAGELASEVRHGALVMALGALLTLYVAWKRLAGAGRGTGG